MQIVILLNANSQTMAECIGATDRGEPIIQAMLAHLRTTIVLLPAAVMTSGGDRSLGGVDSGEGEPVESREINESLPNCH